MDLLLVKGTALRSRLWVRGIGLALAACGLLLLARPGSAQELSTADKADVQKAENYLNAITTLKAHIVQIAPDGSSSEGTVYLSRPGKLRLDYDPPSPVQVIADGSFLIYNDKKLKQVSYVGLDTTPAGILVRQHVKLEGEDLKVLKVSHQPGILAVSVTKANDPAQGRIILIFSEAPFQLKQWQVIDPQGQVTTVSLYNTTTGISLDRDLFYYNDPNLGHGPDLSDHDR